MPLPPPISSDITARNFSPSRASWISTARAMLRLSARRSWPISGAPMFETTATQSLVGEVKGRHQLDTMPLGVEPAHVEEPGIRAATAAGAEDPGADRQRLDVVERQFSHRAPISQDPASAKFPGSTGKFPQKIASRRKPRRDRHKNTALSNS